MKNMKTINLILSLFLTTLLFSCSTSEQNKEQIESQSVYTDVAYQQDYAVKYYLGESKAELYYVFTDRNGIIQILSDKGLLNPNNGHFQYPGNIVVDNSYEPMADKKISDMKVYKNQFVYLDDEAVFSNAWAGKVYFRHAMSDAKIVCGGRDFNFLISNGNEISAISESGTTWSKKVGDKVLDIRFNETTNQYYVLGNHGVYLIAQNGADLKRVFKGENLTGFELTKKGAELVVGAQNGYWVLDATSGKVKGNLNKKLPCSEITSVTEIDEKLWFGSTMGAFMLREDGKFNYYNGERWLPGNHIQHIAKGPENTVLVLSDKGLGEICFEDMTLEKKAMIYEDQVRKRHIRYGFNSNVNPLQNNDLSTNRLHVADSDNLWTSMYLGSQLFRYLVTGSVEAKENCRESFEAMERVHEINGIEGLFGRTFERRGYMNFRKEYRTYVENYWYEGYQGNISWRHADDEEWDWRASASSDQTVGQIFALTLLAEYIDEPEWKNRAIELLDQLIGYIVENNFTLVDYNELPSLWGRWNPEYVNRFDTMIGDRKVYSSNMIAFLQIAYHFTGKEIYKQKATELMENQKYLENLMRPFSEIGNAPEDADGWSKMLSQEWNHSDDEMYFLAYWGLYPYAFNDTLKEDFRWAIKDHWEQERPEKNSLWNFCYAMTGASEFDLDESIWHLKEFPLDLIQFEVKNSHRKDIIQLEPNFWGQTTAEVLPPDERPELKHNRSLFKLDAGDRRSELSAGDTFLLPYWMGRFLGVISAPEKK